MSVRFNVGELLEMLTYCRPSGSATEAEFIARYISVLPGVERDTFRNWHVRIAQADGSVSPILWSCHLDTVHQAEGRQTVDYRKGIVRVSKRSRRGKRGSSCLGADDTAGVALCRQLVLSGTPGHYVFHHGEEIGGEGSYDLAKYASDLLSDAVFAIALDRQGYRDVVTHQWGDRSCSEVFALSLADELRRCGLDGYRPNKGVFTDTAHYVDHIGECTNLSVGYFDQHHKHEALDVLFLSRLFAALTEVDASRLVATRKPGETEQGKWSYALSQQTATVLPFDRDKSQTVLISCEYCGKAYETDESDACEYDTYCSADCEEADYALLSASLATVRDATYLDPEYRDVQAAISSELKRKDQNRGK